MNCRRQFERANIEAMDESAEWRMMFDKERERSKEFEGELSKVFQNFLLNIIFEIYMVETT